MSELNTLKSQPYGFWTLVCLVIANMIGVGVFTTSGFTLASVGSPMWVMVAWLIAGLIAVCGAWSYGQLIQLIPEAGGEYLFLSRTLGPLWGFLAGWVSLIAGFTGAIAFAATAFESYALPEVLRPIWLPRDVLACAAIATAGLAHGLRVRWGAVLQNFIVGLKLLLISVFVWMVTAHWSDDVWHGVATGVDVSGNPNFWLSMATSIIWISLSYSGFNAAIYVAEEAQSAKRNIPRALLVGTVAVFVIYLVLNFVFVYAPARDQIANQEQVAAIAAEVVGGHLLASLVRGVIVIALLTSITSMIMAAPRVYAKMAADGLLPRWLCVESDAPRNAMLVQVALAIAIVLLSTLKDLINYLSVTLALSAAATVACLFVRRAKLRRSARLVLLPAGLFVVCTVFLAVLMAIQEPRNLLGTVVTFVSGIAAYWLFKRKTPLAGECG